MQSKVKRSTRRYDASGRRARAERARQDIVDSAQRRFLANGYARTAVSDIASDAAVSPETVYKAFGSKAALLSAVIRASLRGDADPTPLRGRASIETIRQEPDARRQLELYGAFLARVQPRMAPLAAVMREAAATDVEIEAALRRLDADRLAGMSEFAGLLSARGALRADVSRQEARDVLWTLNSPELYELLVIHRRWSARRYGRWVAQALVAALLP